MTINSSYQSFTIKDCLKIVEGKGDFPLIEVSNENASALISIYGAQVLSYKPKLKSKDIERNDNVLIANDLVDENTLDDDNDLLFVSERAYFEQGKAIKGGIPICWPWFGRDPENLGRQMHGFARNMFWQIDETASTNDGDTKVVLSLTESEDSYKLWPHDFKVIMTITVGKTLRLSLQTINTSKTIFTITQALHAYFSVADIQMIKVDGLDKVQYIDTVNGLNKAKLQESEITVNQEVDRIYTDAPRKTILQDDKLNRGVFIDSSGSKTTVVWNPWVDISKKSADLADDAYQRFICIETANAADDIIEIEPNQSFIIEAEYTAA